MPNLLETLKGDVVAAQKQADTAQVSILRYVLASLKNKEIALHREPNDEEVLAEIAKEIKRHRESVELYKTGGRDELVEKEEKEIAILQTYLPEQLSEDQIAALVDQAIASTGATSKQDMGKVIGAVMAKAKGQAEGAVVSRLVAQKLA